MPDTPQNAGVDWPYLRLLIAGVLGWGLSGLLLIYSIEDGGVVGWIVFATWVLAFALMYVLAFRRYARAKREGASRDRTG